LKVIDVHTHFFPDAIAADTVRHLESISGVKAYGDGTLASLRKFMKEDSVAISINAPVATKPEQVVSINRKMIEHNSQPENRDVICFGAMHPMFGREGNFAEEIEFIAKSGIKGIKMHPEYQQFYPDDGKLKPLYEACVKYGIIILFHSGEDFAFEDYHSTPKRFVETAKIRGLKLILAHMGAYRMWDEVYKQLVGKDVYFDTAYCDEMEPGVFKGLIKEHGPDKILFGTDFPWERAAVIIKKIDENVESADDREKIFHLNAEKLLLKKA
jgi:uncharacterized protein